MGEVYDAVDPSLGRHVALKVLRPSDGSLSRFVQEARSASALNHPHVVSIYEIGEQDGVHFIAMEKIDGQTLRAVFSSGAMAIPRALELLLQITEAVAAAHAAGIVHRDLKPENIMVSRSGYAKVLDFGLAKLQTVLSGDPSPNTILKPTDSGTVLGTVGYMAPEQAQGQRADERSDVFALGCILYEAVAGRRAFHAPTAIDTLHQLIHEDPPPLDRASPPVPADVQRIVRKAMNRDPDLRYQSVRDLAIDLREARDVTQSVARPVSAPSILPRTLRWFSIFLLAGVVLAAIALRFARAPAAPALQIQRLTNSGDVINAIISSDGRYMAYVRYEDQGQSLWLRQLATNLERRLVAPLPAAASSGIWGQTFTPDGDAILLAVKRIDDQAGTLYRVRTFGGTMQPLLRGIDSPVSFSPDGKRITWVRADFPRPGESALMVASSDGGSPRAIAIRKTPELFAPIWYTGPSWAPEGSLIAVALRHGERSRIIGVDADSGRHSVIADHGWRHVGRVQWLPHGKALLAIAGMGTARLEPRLWLVPVRGGEPRMLIRDANGYRNLTLTSDGKTLMSVAVLPQVPEVWRVPLDPPGEPERLLTGGALEFGGLSYLPDGRMAVASRGVISTVQRAADGAVVTPIVDDGDRNERPLAFTGGIAYQSSTADGDRVCVLSHDGKKRTVLAHGVLQAITRDGQKLVYSRGGVPWVRTIATGREHPLIAAAPRSGIDLTTLGDMAWSPDGERVAFMYGTATSRRLGVISAETGALEWSTPTNAPTRWVRWTLDGSALLTSSFGEDRANVWRVPFDGPAQRLTNFRDQYAFNLDLSPDGRELALVRSRTHRDAVLITGFE